jgi:hypothetical protein
MGWRSIAVVPVLAAASLLGGAAPGGAAQGARPVVTDAVQVTPDPSIVRAHTSPQMARNPKNGELVVVEGDIRGSRKCTVHISVDDGRSWFEGGDPLLPPDTDCSFHADWGPYATLAFDKNGVLNMAIEASDPAVFASTRNDAPRDIFLARSTDSGRTFTTTQVLKAEAGNPNKGINKGATIAVDPKDPKNIYIGWRQGAFGSPAATEKLKTMVAASTDAGKTWSPAVDITDEHGGDFPWLTVTGDGVLHVAYWVRLWPLPATGTPDPVRPIYHVSSADHGKTWSARTVIDPGNQKHEHPPVIVSDPRTNALYVTWAGNADPMNEAAGFNGDMEIFFRSSTDGGKTWTDRLVLNDDPKGKANQIDPGIAVAPNGRIDVAWYDGRLSTLPVTGDTENGFNDVYATSSTDGGVTFGPNIRVSDRSSDRSIGVWSNNVDQRLNVGVTSSNDGMYVAWQDTRNANREFQPEDVYMASVKMDTSYITGTKGSTSVPPGLALAAGVALGLGLAIFAAPRIASRAGSRAPVTT